MVFILMHPISTKSAPVSQVRLVIGLIAMILWGLLGRETAFGAQRDFKKVGQVSARFLTVPNSVRLSALGGDQVAAFGQAADSASNPASLSLLPTAEAWLSHQESFAGTQYESLGLGFPTRRHAFAAGVRYINEGRTNRVTWEDSSETATTTGRFQWSTLLANVSYGGRLANRWAWGATLKGWREERARSSAAGVAGDVGILLPSFFPRLDLGVAVRNVGPSVDGFSLPRTWAFGGAYQLLMTSNWISTLFSEWDAASHREGVFRGGIEIQRRPLALRLGYESGTDAQDASLARFSMGAGLRIKNWHIDYAWVPNSELGDQQRVAVRVMLGLTPDEKEQKAREMDAAIEQRMKQKSALHQTAAAQAMESQKWREARDHLTQALQWDSSNPELARLLQDVEARLNQERAQASFQEGEIHFKRKEWLEAAYAWQRALQLDPSHREATRGLTFVQEKLKSPAAAATKTSGWFNKGVSMYLEGDYAGALEQWKRVLNEDPNYAGIREYIAKAHVRELEDEVRHLKTLQKKDLGETEALSQQAYLFYRLGKIDKAISLWKRVLALNPDDADARASLREAEQKQQLVAEVSNPSRRVVELNAQAMQAYQDGRVEEAVRLWRAGLKEDPGNRWIQGSLKRAESELAAQGKSK